MGICPAALKNHAVFGSSKYSAFARYVTLRTMHRGRKNESQNDWWLAARIAGPLRGTERRFTMRIRKTKKKIGDSTILSAQ